MRKRALHRDIRREFTRSITRFLSILLMIALGSFIFVGLYVTGPTMRRTLLQYVDAYNLPDVIVSTPFGLEPADQAIISRLPDVSEIDFAWRSDVLLQGTSQVVRLEGLSSMPAYELTAGRLPEAMAEIALDNDLQSQGYELGQVVLFSAEKQGDTYPLLRYSYEIVGFVHSPEYLQPDDKGTAAIGDGKVSAFGVILATNFTAKNYSLARLRFADTAVLDRYTDRYKTLMAAHAQALDDHFANRPEVRLARYREEGLDEIVTAEGEISDAEQALIDARQELLDARAELDEAWQDYEEGQETFDREIKDAKRKIADGEAELADARIELDDGAAELADGEAEWAQALADYRDGEAELDDAASKLAAARRKLEAGQRTLDASQSELDKQSATVEAGLVQINGGLAAAGLPTADDSAVVQGLLASVQSQLSTAQKALSDVEAALAAASTDPVAQAALIAELTAQRETLLRTIGELTLLGELLQTKLTLLEARSRLAAGQAELDAAHAELDAGWEEYEDGFDDYQDGIAKLQAGWIELSDGQRELDEARQKLADGEAEYADGLAELEDARQTLVREQAKGRRELADAYTQLIDGEAEYEEGLEEYLSELPEAKVDIAEGKAELNTARRDLARLKIPKYTVLDNYKEPGFFQYIENSESMDFLSLIFPVFFFLIALLVSLTTMTRMVDEQRLMIGTLKALSYSNWDIMKKYFAYGGLASLIGSLIGIVAGQKILMPVVVMAYSTNFLAMPVIPELNPLFSVLAILISQLCTGFVALVTTRASLRENVAGLLRPKAPKAGTRILLERIRPIWSRLSFHSKVTARNIFRYRKRMTMTILGVAGCAALIFMGFGIRDSIGSILGKQYGDLFRYDSIVIYDDGADPEDLAAFEAKLAGDARIGQREAARIERGVISVPGKLDQDLTVIVPADEARFRELNLLRDRLSQRPIALEQGAVISEKLAMLLRFKPGDTLEFEDADGHVKTIGIAALTENYTGHYLYLPREVYETSFGKPFKPNSAFIVLDADDAAASAQFQREQLADKLVLSAVNTRLTSQTVEKLVGAMNIVVIVILLASSMLAMVVLYNLTNINVSERTRELSTIMVLGFYPREVTAYVYRETLMLTGLGILFGFVFGRGLHYFVISSLAPSNVLLDPAVLPATYLLSAAFTFGFSLIVMLIMHRRLTRLDMVSALKAVE
jgi:putative ABC transport system permease protein